MWDILQQYQKSGQPVIQSKPRIRWVPQGVAIQASILVSSYKTARAAWKISIWCWDARLEAVCGQGQALQERNDTMEHLPPGFFPGDREIDLAEKNLRGNSPAVQWLGLGAFATEGLGSIPAGGTKMPQATWHSQKNNKSRKNCKRLWRGEVFLAGSKIRPLSLSGFRKAALTVSPYSPQRAAVC